MTIEKGHTIPIHGTGYVKLIDWMGRDEDFIEAARMSTDKGFYGWFWEEDTYANVICKCGTQHLQSALPTDNTGAFICTACGETHGFSIQPNDERKLLGRKGEKRDLSLLEFLYMNKHSTPFEMGEMVVEVASPLMVVREHQRHRTQSYNELSGRYSKIPNAHYVHSIDRMRPKKTANKQESSLAGAGAGITDEELEKFRIRIIEQQQDIFDLYEEMLDAGIPKEVARTNCPLSRYSKMRAKTDVRNWLGFLLLRMPNNAMWEIRQVANAIATFIRALFPRTFALYVEHDFYGVRFSRTEMAFLRRALSRTAALSNFDEKSFPDLGMTKKDLKRLTRKIQHNLEEDYKDVPVLQDS